MTRWMVLEKWLQATNPAKFTAYTLAASLGITVSEASYLINGYLVAQRGKRTQTQYLLKREGRTRGAVWSVGEQQLDFDAFRQTLMRDIEVKVNRAAKPDMNALGQLNPQIQQKVNLTISAIDAALSLLAVALK